MELTFFEQFLLINPALVVLIVGIPLALVIWFGAKLSARRSADREAAELGKEALAIIAGGFIFVGAFAIVTSWDNQSTLAKTVSKEFTSVTALAEDLGGVGTPSAGNIAEGLLSYAEIVKETEAGTLGVIAYNLEAQHQLVLVESAVDDLVNTSELTTHQVDNIYSHLEAIKDARKDRLTVSVPNLPPSILIVMLLSAALALFGLAIFPPSRVKWVKFYYLGAALSVVVALFVTVFILQSPLNAVQQVTKPIDLFIGSMTMGGANLEQPGGEQPEGGEPPEGEQPSGEQPSGAPSMSPPPPAPAP
jgi:hypothetical protein